MSGFTHIRKGELEYLTVPSFAEAQFPHAFSTRKGGVSEGEVGSLNLGFNRPDAPENVRQNYRIITKAIGVSMESLVLSAQTHTDHIRLVTRQDCGEGITHKTFADVDALMTNEAGVTLVVFSADCTPIALADPVHRAVCLIHSGWRGTAKQIAKKAVEAMGEAFGSHPKDILAAIGPCAGPCCYEVSRDVGEALKKAGGDCLVEFPDKNPHADLWTANRNILLSSGITPEHITLCGECTVHDPLYFSHRRQGADRGSLAVLLSVGKEEEK